MKTIWIWAGAFSRGTSVVEKVSCFAEGLGREQWRP